MVKLRLRGGLAAAATLLALVPAGASAAPPVWEANVGAALAGVSAGDDVSTEPGNPVTFGTFNFPFYGTSYTGATHITISSNGFVLLGTHAGAIGEDNTPTGAELTTVAAPRIAPYWHDLNAADAPSEQGNVFMNTFNDDGDPAIDRMVITWAANSFSCPDGPPAFPACANRAQAQLREDGTIVFGYDGLFAGSDPALIGVGTGSQAASADPGSRDFSAVGYPVAITSPGYELFRAAPLQVDLDQRNLVLTPAGSQGFSISQLGGDVGVTLSAPAAVTAGGTVGYTATVTNNGEAPVTGTTLVDALPSGAALVSAPGCTGTSVLSCALGTLAPGASAAVPITVTATTPGELTNTVAVRVAERGDPAGDNRASATTTVGEPPPPDGSSPGQGRPAPVAALSAPAQRLRDLRKRGLRVAITCDAECGFDVTARVGKSDAKRLGLRSRVLASASGGRASAGTTTLALRIAKRVAKRARRLSRLRVQLSAEVSTETGEVTVPTTATIRR